MIAPKEIKINAWITVIGENTVRVWPDPIRVPPRVTAKIAWTIVVDGWTFPANGIVIPSGPGRVPPAIVNAKEFGWVNDNTKPKGGSPSSYAVDGFKYIINLVNGDRSATLDPAIENENC